MKKHTIKSGLVIEIISNINIVLRITTEETIGCFTEAAVGANKAPRNPPSCFFISCFDALVIPSINTVVSSSDFMILMISFISSFEINKGNPFPTLTASLQLIFLSNLFIAFKAKLLTSPCKWSLGKGMVGSVVVLFPKLPNQEPRDPSNWIILDIWAFY